MALLSASTGQSVLALEKLPLVSFLKFFARLGRKARQPPCWIYQLESD